MTVVYVSRYSLYIFIASERMLIQVFEKKNCFWENIFCHRPGGK